LFAETPSESNGNVQSRQIPFLPGKIILGRSQIRQIALERKQGLDEYCQVFEVFIFSLIIKNVNRL
jgi:hypothetical protein